MSGLLVAWLFQVCVVVDGAVYGRHELGSAWRGRSGPPVSTEGKSEGVGRCVTKPDSMTLCPVAHKFAFSCHVS